MREDTAWKQVITSLFREFMEFFFPEIARDIDFSRPHQFLDKEFQQIQQESRTGRQIVDKLVQVFLKDGKEKWLLIHIEIQGHQIKNFAERMFIYNNRIYDAYRREVISLALLTDRNPSYRPNLFQIQRWGFRHIFEFPLVKIVDYISREEEIREEKNIFALGVRAYLKTLETEGDFTDRYRWKKQFLIRLYDVGLKYETISAMFRFIEWIMKLPKDLDQKLVDEIIEIEKEKKMSLLIMAEKKGFKEGIQKGIRKGKREVLIKAILGMLEVKFNTIEPETIRSLRKIKSVEKLEQLLDEAKTTPSLEAFKSKI